MQAIPVNSGVPQGCNDPEQFAAAIANRGGQASWRNLPEQLFLLLPRTRVFWFSSQENFFSPIKNKIHFLLVDFESGF
jgi:hypothetical protein